MKFIDQETIQEVDKQLADYKCRDQGTHYVDLHALYSGPPSLPVSEKQKIIQGHCVRCGLPVRIPQFLS